MLTPHNSELTTQNSQLTTQAVDVLFHPTSRSANGACPLHPPTEPEMDQAGIGIALVSQCKKWSCERQWMCVDTRLPDVLRYTQSSPRFLGLAGYNPYDIAESLREIELAVITYGFRGIYMHAASFRLPLTDARIYPLFAKAAELAVPVLVQLPSMPGLHQAADCIAADFPDLSLVLAQPRPHLSEIAAISIHCENVFFALDSAAVAHVTREWRVLADERGSSAAKFFSEVFQQRCMWGSNGMDWDVAPPLSLPGEPAPNAELDLRANFLRNNARRVFVLHQPLAARLPRSAPEEILAAER